MKPIPDKRLGSIEAVYNSVSGTIKSSWRYEGDKWIWEFSIPDGCTASVTIPGESESREYISGDYKIVRCIESELNVGPLMFYNVLHYLDFIMRLYKMDFSKYL